MTEDGFHQVTRVQGASPPSADGHYGGAPCSRHGAEVHIVVGRGPHATRRRIQRQVHGAGARRLPRPRAALRAMAPARLQPRRRPGADGTWGLRGCRRGAELHDPARHLGGFGRRRRFRGRRNRPSRNRSRPRLSPLRPYSVMVFFRSSFPRKRDPEAFVIEVDSRFRGNDGLRWRTGRGGGS